MVCQWGMTDSLGPVTYDENSEEGVYMMPGQSIKKYSDETAQQIDAEVRKLLDQANDYATKIISEKKDKLQLMADMLIEFEVLDKEDVLSIMEGSWDPEKKKGKLKAVIEANRKQPPPPPKREEPSKGDDITPSPQHI